MSAERSGFNRERFLANAHACCAGTWLAGMGLFPPMEGVAFAGLALLSAIRWRSTVDAIADRSIRTPMVLVACLLGWMLAACAWGASEGGWFSGAPHRTLLGIFMVLGARMPAWGLLISISVPGLWWGIGMFVTAAGLSDASVFVPRHRFETNFAFTGLAAYGIAGIVVRGSAWLRATGAVALLWAAMGLGVMATRTSIVSVLAALLFCLAVRTVRDRDWRPAAVSVAVMIVVFTAIPFLPVWAKATHYLAQEPEWSIEAHPSPVVQIYRRADPSRAFLHEWTAVRIPDSPIFGHGAGSWRLDLMRGVPHATEPPSRFEVWWPRVQTIRYPHQVYLQAVYEYGLLGLGLLFCVGASLAMTCLRRRLDVPMLAALSILVAAAVSGLADYDFNSRFTAFTLTTVLALASCRPRPEVPGQAGQVVDASSA